MCSLSFSQGTRVSEWPHVWMDSESDFPSGSLCSDGFKEIMPYDHFQPLPRWVRDPLPFRMDAKCFEGIVIFPFIKLNSSRLNDKNKKMYLRMRQNELPLESCMWSATIHCQGHSACLEQYQKKIKKELEQWSSTFLMLRPFNAVPHFAVTLTIKLFSLLVNNCKES